MTVPPDQAARLRFLQRVVRRERELLQETTAALFAGDAAQQDVGGNAALTWQLPAGPLSSALSERLDAFVARFARLQDSLGDKLLPALLLALAEPVGAALDNLGIGERLGWFDSVELWRSVRALRNQMIHDYVEDRRILEGALSAARDAVPMLCAVATRMSDEVDRRLP